MSARQKSFLIEDEIIGRAYDSRLARRLYQYVRPYLRHAGLGLFCLLASSAAQLAGPYLVKVAIDRHITPGVLEGFGWLIAAYLGVIAVDFIFRFCQIYITNYLGQQSMYHLRMDVFRHLQRLSLRFFDRNPVGRLVTRTTNDIEVLNELFSTGLVTVIGDIAMIAGIMVAMFLLSPRLALLMFLILPLLALITFYFQRRMREGFRAVRVRIARINAYLQEALTGMSITQLFNRQQQSRHRFEEYNRDHMEAHLQTIHYYALFYPLIDLIGAVALGLILWYGGARVMDGALTFGVLVAFIQYVEKFFKPISDLSEKYNIFQAALASSERIFGLLDSREWVPEPERPMILDHVHGRVEFRAVQFAYNPGEPVLKGIDLAVEPGEKIAIVGSTGAGKTTIINLLARFYDPQEGAVLLDGVDIRHFDKRWLRQNIGIALQDVFIFSGTVAGNIALGEEDPPRERILAAVESIGALEFIQGLPGGLDHVLTERGATLSSGQRQLLSFARVMYKNPRILVLDEATSSVDTHTEILIQQALERLIAGRTSLVIAHRLSTIRHVDRIVVMHHGRIVESGSHQQLLEQRGIYHDLYQLQYKDQEQRIRAGS